MAAVDKFAAYQAGHDAAHSFGAVVIPSDSTDLAHVSRALWVGGAGTLTVDMPGATGVLFSGVPAGVLLPLRVSRVRATGTTATLIVALD